jgi:GNAT superfamily N-acetyltransferase
MVGFPSYRCGYSKVNAMQMLTIRPERIDHQLWGELQPLLRAHWEEIALNKAEIPLAPDFETYRAMSLDNALIMLTVRDEMAQLVGYSCTFLTRHPHYRTRLLAANDVIYLVPAQRKWKTGTRLIMATEQAAREAGADWMTWHFKPEHSLAPILLKMGYNNHENTMAKVLTEKV